MSASRSFLARLRQGDEIARLMTFLCAASVVLITVLLVFQLWSQSALPRHKFGFGFFLTRVWDPVAEEFGALPFIYGTLVTAGLALLISVPLGIGAAIFLAELAPQRISDTLQFFIDLLAAVPSVIYGFLGFFVVAPLMREWIAPALKNSLGFLPVFQGPSYGIGLLTAGIVLAIMVIPYIISVSREVLLSVPRDQREAALALGSTRWESTWKVVVPFARTGIKVRRVKFPAPMMLTPMRPPVTLASCFSSTRRFGPGDSCGYSKSTPRDGSCCFVIKS